VGALGLLGGLTLTGCDLNNEFWRFGWPEGITEQATEQVTVRGGVGPGEHFAFGDPGTMSGWLRDQGLWTAQQRLDRHRLHPHHLLLARRSDPSTP